jgi:NADPH:quinone reductase-like Zn-dependent oxidoreductase
MKAIVQDKYGSPDVLELREIDKPVVKDDEVLVRVHAASVHPDVWHVVRGRPYALRLMGAGLLKPKNSVPGTDAAGHVESVGKNVTQFQPGDEVFGETSRQWQWHNGGAYAEYVAVPEDQLALKLLLPPSATRRRRPFSFDIQRLRVFPVDPVADAAQPREVAQVLHYVRQSGACAAS